MPPGRGVFSCDLQVGELREYDGRSSAPGTLDSKRTGSKMTEPAPETLTGDQSLVRALEHAGVEVIFGIPGGAILPAYDPLFDSSIRHILVRHEQGAGHAAQGYA